MAGRDRERLIFHGAVVLSLGLLCGFLTVTEWGDETLRAWRSAHLTLILTGVWLLATAAVMPSLVLRRVELAALRWSLLAAGYGLAAALVIEALAGVRGIAPKAPLPNLAAFAANVIVVMGGLTAAGLTLMGARAARDGVAA